MAATRPRIRLDKTEISAGDIIDVRTLIAHTMESGQRRDRDGNVIPRSIINTFKCEFEGEVVFACDMEPAISANPYFQFKFRPDRSGTLVFTWVDDNGSVTTASEDITVT
jgi:sulfur-oxidizing protein SoxZ